ncbi:major outer membrane protein [Campylobacter sp.]|uniref:major outer membrane protein n=1 Tax=Campylobacter sp. TaxID=205 RepID=UPI0025B8ED41|nr:major outer membrane protein [Campylobacter sp.]
MKLVKLSLVAALAAGAFSAANAVSLEEAIKDVDVSGMLRYRFDSDRSEQGHVISDGYNSSKNNMHKFKSQLNFKAALDDNFKAFVQFQYSTGELGFGNNGETGSNFKKVGTNTHSTFAVKQAYLEYMNEAYATSVMFGKMEVDSIWTDDSIGTGAKVLNNSIDGLTFAGYWFDSFNDIDDGNFADFSLKNSSLYGGAVLGDFDPFAFQLWAAYSAGWAYFYAVDASYKFSFGDMANFKVEGQYLGNSVKSHHKKGPASFTNGNFYAGMLKGDVSDFDFQAGIVSYGDKNDYSFVTIEDNGQVIAPGKQIFYSDGSSLNGDIGKNFFYFAGVGYTFAETLRVGFDYIGGNTKTADITPKSDEKIDKSEFLGSVSYAYSPKLTFSGFYSYLIEDSDLPNEDKNKDQFIRLEALYKF